MTPVLATVNVEKTEQMRKIVFLDPRDFCGGKTCLNQKLKTVQKTERKKRVKTKCKPHKKYFFTSIKNKKQLFIFLTSKDV